MKHTTIIILNLFAISLLDKAKVSAVDVACDEAVKYLKKGPKDWFAELKKPVPGSLGGAAFSDSDFTGASTLYWTGHTLQATIDSYTAGLAKTAGDAGA